MDPVIWIVLGVIALIVVIALIALATRNNNRRKLSEAAELRRDVHQREQALDREHAVAREQEHRAAAAEQEAQAKVAEADKLRVDADRHHDALGEQQRDVARMERTADELDPRHRSTAGGPHRAEPDGSLRPEGDNASRTGPGGAHRRGEPSDGVPRRNDPPLSSPDEGDPGLTPR